MARMNWSRVKPMKPLTQDSSQSHSVGGIITDYRTAPIPIWLLQKHEGDIPKARKEYVAFCEKQRRSRREAVP